MVNQYRKKYKKNQKVNWNTIWNIENKKELYIIGRNVLFIMYFINIL